MIKSAGYVESRNAMYLLVCGIILLILINFISVRPLSKVQNNVRRYTSDKDTDKIVEELSKIKSKNEIGRLADDVSTMAVELQNYSRDLLFVTIWVGILDLTTGEIVCANGGHEFPMIKSKEGGFKLEEEEVAIPLGIMEGMVFPEQSHTLSPGDLLPRGG